MKDIYKDLVESRDEHRDGYFELESMIIVKRVINLNSYDKQHQYRIKLIRLILDGEYTQVEKLLKERKEQLEKECKKLMEK